MDTDLTKKNYNKQSHFIINAKYALNVREINMLLTLLTAVDKDDEDFKDYIFTLSDFKEKTDITMTTNNLNQVIKSLMSKPLEIKISDKKWEIFSWFSYFKFENSVITCRFDKDLKPYLLEIKERFVISDLRVLLSMKSSYSKRIYLLLKEYSKIGSRTFEVQELQEILKAPKGMRRYDNFKRQVLQRAEKDINKFTELEIKLSEKKLGKKVVKITYSIRKNTTDLKTFIIVIREHYTNTILHYSKNNRPIKCSSNGFLYYGDEENSRIDKKEAQKLWEYLHENRENLYVFKKNLEESKKNVYLANIEFFKEYLKKEFVNKKIIQLKQRDRLLDISIFPNGKLYDMSGESLDYEEMEKIWDILYGLAKDGKLGVSGEK